MNGMMKEIHVHCSDLSKFISGYNAEIEWSTQFDWLKIASGIKKVKFNTIRFDNCIGYCRNADDYSFSLEELLEKYVTELTRFTYLWGTLESLIDELNPPPAPKRGKVYSICYYLQNKLTQKNIIYPYLDLVDQLKYVLHKNRIDEPEILKRFDDATLLSEHGTGLYVIYRLRNLFVHGSIGFPAPDEENRPISFYPNLVAISNRIILLSLQMIWLAFYSDKAVYSSIHWEPNDNGIDEFPIEEILHKIHLKDYKYQNNKVPT